MRSRTMVPALALATALTGANPAGAQSPPAGSDDPEGTSPPGAVYEIPLDTARRSGAPRQRDDDDNDAAQGGAAPATPPSGPGSSVRSENGFGSSSVVPGDPRPKADREPKRDGSKDRDGSRSSAAKQQTGGAPAVSEAAIRPTAAASSPSVPRVLLLLALAAVLAVGFGIAARRASRGG